jgi:hypothetical protein
MDFLANMRFRSRGRMIVAGPYARFSTSCGEQEYLWRVQVQGREIGLPRAWSNGAIKPRKIPTSVPNAGEGCVIGQYLTFDIIGFFLGLSTPANP